MTAATRSTRTLASHASHPGGVVACCAGEPGLDGTVGVERRGPALTPDILDVFNLAGVQERWIAGTANKRPRSRIKNRRTFGVDLWRSVAVNTELGVCLFDTSVDDRNQPAAIIRVKHDRQAKPIPDAPPGPIDLRGADPVLTKRKAWIASSSARVVGQEVRIGRYVGLVIRVPDLPEPPTEHTTRRPTRGREKLEK